MDQTPIVLAHEKPFRIGQVEVRPSTRELVYQGTASIVEPRVMQMLVALHRANGAVVSKDDLIRLCWDGRIVGEDAINRVVGRLRHDAEEKAGSAFKIETITKVGYRLVDVEVSPGSSVAAEPVDRRRALVIGGAVAAIAGGSLVAWQLLGGDELPTEARQLHEQGWDAMREGTVDQYANAVAKFRSATELAPERAELWGSLALAYQLQSQFASSFQLGTLREKGMAAANRALAIDPDDPDALTARAISVGFYQNWLTFERNCRAALDRAPRHPLLNISLGGVLAQVGRTREALQYVERAVQAEPRAPRFQMFHANALWDVGRIEEAESVIEQAFRLWPRHYAIWFSRLYILAYNGRAQEALAMINDISSRPIGIPDWNFEATALQAEALANPMPEIIDRAVAAALDVARRGVGLAEGAIQFTAAINRVDASYSILDGYYFDRGFKLGEQRFSKEQGMYSGRRERHTYILFTQRLASVRRDPRFGALLEELGLEDYWRSAGTTPDFRTRD